MEFIVRLGSLLSDEKNTNLYISSGLDANFSRPREKQVQWESLLRLLKATRALCCVKAVPVAIG